MAARKSNTPLLLGLTAAGGVGYYLYKAGGSPKAAEKRFESDIHSASAKIRGELPPRDSALGKAENKVDEATERARAGLAQAESKVDEYGSQIRKDTREKINAFDKKVEEGASKAKSGVSGWFGSSK
ncbi:hypothetical protein F5884DRAFT_766675 [Xylogone sp. PMI_703]|nr:hypothetical protein F5884DRAFT_766675 [Xylogone sp. PMI_703]